MIPHPRAARRRRPHVNGIATSILLASIAVSLVASVAAADQQPMGEYLPAYKVGDAIPVSCLNRTIETGEHIMDAQGRLQYIPFPTCNETGRPLELYFGVEKDMNCTIDFIDDTLFHLLEFYIHNDAPLTCRIPNRPLPAPLTSTTLALNDQVGALGTQSTAYTPMIIALTGTLQQSHIHISSHLNVLLHAGSGSSAKYASRPAAAVAADSSSSDPPSYSAASDIGTIEAATAYSVSRHPERSTRIIIGDALPLRLSVRWYPSTRLPSGWPGVGGHLYLSTLVYCCLSAGAAVAICVAWFRGVELPRRLKGYGRDRVGGGGFGGFAGGAGAGAGGAGAGVGGGGAGGGAGPRYGGYGYGLPVGNGYGYTSGKRD